MRKESIQYVSYEFLGKTAPFLCMLYVSQPVCEFCNSSVSLDDSRLTVTTAPAHGTDDSPL